MLTEEVLEEDVDVVGAPPPPPPLLAVAVAPILFRPICGRTSVGTASSCSCLMPAIKGRKSFFRCSRSRSMAQLP